VPGKRDAVDEMLRQWSRERPDLDTTGMGIVLRVLSLAGRFSDRLKEILAPTGLAAWEFDVLSALRRSGPRAALNPGELCESAQLTSGAMTHRLDRLEERGLVRRRAARADRRSVEVTLTRKGLALVDQVIGTRMADAADSVRGLGAADRRQLERMLRRLMLELEEARPASDGTE
jgi:DNA-binding MarR family transcriptional regulator